MPQIFKVGSSVADLIIDKWCEQFGEIKYYC